MGQFSPSCVCCAPPCVIFDHTGIDDYSAHFTELAGSWSYGDVAGVGYIETSSSSGGIYCNNPAVKTTWKLLVKFKYTPGAGSSNWRLAVGADINNYLFAEVIITQSGGNDYCQVRLGQNVSGSVTYLADLPYSATDIDYSSDVASGANEFMLELFRDSDDVLSADLQSSAGAHVRESINARNVANIGSYAGIYVQTMNGTLRVSEFSFEHIFPDPAACVHIAQNCSRGLPLEEALVELADGSPTTQTYSYRDAGGITQSGTFDCADMLGTWSVYPSSTPAGDNNCIWTSNVATGDFGSGTHDLEELWVEMTLSRPLSSGEIPGQFERQINVVVRYRVTTGVFVHGATVASFTTAIGPAHHPDAMEDWSDVTWFNIPEVVFDAPACHSSGGLTCRVKKP